MTAAVMQQALIGSYSSGGGAATLLATATTTDSTYTLNESYNYPFSVSAGDSVVIAFSCRVNGFNGSSTYTVTDSAGNTWTQVASTNQSNGLTQAAIFRCDVTTAVTTSSTITLASTGGDNNEELGIGWFHFGTGTVSVVDSTTSKPAPSGSLSETINMGSETGTAIHVLGTGLTYGPSISSSTGFTELLASVNTGSNIYIYYKENVTGSVTNTVDPPGGSWCSVMAGVA